VRFNLARTVQFATATLSTQRAIRIQAPTYAFVGASVLTTSATVAISGAPIAGTNATLSNAYALWIEGGQTRFDGVTRISDGDSTNPGLRFAIASGTGVYSFGSAGSSGVAITAEGNWRITANTTTVDIRPAGSGSATASFTSSSATFATTVRLPAGSQTAPAIQFADDDDGTGGGLYRAGANFYGFSVNGLWRQTWDTATVDVRPSGSGSATASFTSSLAKFTTVTNVCDGLVFDFYQETVTLSSGTIVLGTSASLDSGVTIIGASWVVDTEITGSTQYDVGIEGALDLFATNQTVRTKGTVGAGGSSGFSRYPNGFVSSSSSATGYHLTGAERLAVRSDAGAFTGGAIMIRVYFMRITSLAGS